MKYHKKQMDEPKHKLQGISYEKNQLAQHK